MLACKLSNLPNHVFRTGTQKETRVKKIFFWGFISLNDMNQEFGCGRGVIDVLTHNLPEGTE